MDGVGTRKKPRALVTGGAGFLGSHLCERLLSEGYRVLCMDNLITGSYETVAHLVESEPDFEYVDHDVSTHIEVPGELDEIYHFASPASPKDFARFPIPILKVGAMGTHNSLGLARLKGARFMLASTSEVYGDPLVHPQPEEYRGNVNQVGIRGVYDEAKRYAEAMTMAYRRYHRLDTRIVRIFNTYGPRMRPRDGRVVSNFIVQALMGEPLTVYGDGSQTRSFCYVDDMIRGLVLLAESDVHEPVNLGNPVEMPLLEMAELIVELTESRSEIVFEALPVDDPQVRQPDITRAKQLLGWEPEVDVREGLRRTIAHYTRVLGEPASR
jgi:dTDP-glucose 4,6-dehydratase